MPSVGTAPRLQTRAAALNPLPPPPQICVNAAPGIRANCFDPATACAVSHAVQVACDTPAGLLTIAAETAAIAQQNFAQYQQAATAAAADAASAALEQISADEVLAQAQGDSPINTSDPAAEVDDPDVTDPTDGPFFPIYQPVPGTAFSLPTAGISALPPVGIPSDCAGYAAPAQFINPLLIGRGRIRCLFKLTSSSVAVCMAVKRLGVSIFSKYSDIGCGAFQFYGKRAVTPLQETDFFCQSAKHKYRTHVYVVITRGSQGGVNNGYQAGRKQATC